MAKSKKTPFEFFSVTADVMVLRRKNKQIEVLLIRRKYPPFKSCWALPGGYVEKSEDTLKAARRELREETGLRCGPLAEVGSFSHPKRDPRGRALTVCYRTFLTRGSGTAKAGDDAHSLNWFPIKKLPRLAFDHRQIIKKGLTSLN